MSSLSNLRLARIAALGTLVAVLGLAGCGRKGGLNPPPASVADQNAVALPAPGPEIGPDERAPQPQAARRGTPIDWLLD